MAFLPLVHPSTFLVVGPTQAGKTHFVMQLLRERAIRPEPERFIWIYNEWQPTYEMVAHFVEFRKELNQELYDSLDPQVNNMLVLDDQMAKLKNSELLERLFTQGSHHRNMSVLHLVQNMFESGSKQRTVSINAQYMVIFKNPRDKSQIRTLAFQMFPDSPKFLVDAFKDATIEPHGYLLLDLRQETPEELRVRRHILPSQQTEVYTAATYKREPIELYL